MIPQMFLKPNGKSPSKMNNPDDEDDLNLDLITKAMNNSFVRQMSGAHEQNVDDLLFIINAFALGHLKPPHRQLSQRKWCIVELDEEVFDSKGFFSNVFTCGASTNSDATDKPISLKLYCLVLNMENEQLHFQSLQDPDKHLFINFDTIPVQLIAIEEGHPFKKQLISIRVSDKLKVDIYISPLTMPYPYSVKASQKQQQHEAETTKKALELLIKKSIASSRGRELKLSSVLKYEDQFSQRRFITEQQFTNYCETGDILLFRDNHTMAKVQRAVLSSQFDHVGVVYKHQKYGICLFQSNSGLGVAMAVWNQLIRHHWFKNIERITWRKLQIHDKPKDFDEKVTEFVKANLHKKFSLSLPKLLKFKSNVYHDEKKDYFCSELVGTLYKFLGLLDPDVSATQYWPKHFSDKGDLNMKNGAALDPERQIIFQEKLLKKNYPFYKE